MPDIQAHLPDGKTVLHFPDGTDPAVIQGVVKKQLGVSDDIPGSTTQMPKLPVAPQPFAGNQMQTVISPQSVKDTAWKVGRGATLGAFSGLGIPESQSPISDLLKGLASHVPSGAELLDPTAGALTSAFGLGKAEIGSGKEAYQGISQGDPEQAAHGVSSGLTRALMLKDVARGTTGAPEAARVGAQKTLGVGPEFIKQGAEKVGEENANLVGKHQEATAEAAAGRKAKIDQARISEPQAFAEADAKHQQRVQTVQQANAESQAGFNQRQQHLDIANQHAQAIADQLPQLHQAARAEASAAYGPQPKGTYDPVEVKTAIEDTAQSKLQGNTKLPTAVTKIISDIEKPPEPTLLDQASVFKGAGKASRAAGSLDNLSPKARALMIQNNPSLARELSAPERGAGPESTGKPQPLDAQRIHGFMSELGRAAQSGSLSGDEISSINATRSMLEGRLRKLYDNEGRLGDFKAGQAAWKQMANTFENASAPAKGGSPIAQALQTKDPVTGKLRPDYVQAALSGDRSFPIAQEMLNRYKHLGAPTSELEVMKTNGDFAEKLPSQVKWKPTPEGPNYPTFTKFGDLPKTPEPPTLANYDPVEARKVALKQKAQSLSGTGGPYGVMRDVMGMKGLLTGNPMALSYPVLRRILGSSVGGEKLIDWLSRATPEEMQAAKDIPASKVALKRAQQSSLSGGIRFDTDTNGTKWAVDPNGVRVSIPQRIIDSGDIQSYARQKLDEQVAMRKNLGAK